LGVRSTAQLVQEFFRGNKIGAIETFGEPVIVRLKASDGIGGAAPSSMERCEARGGTQLPGEL